MTKHWPPPPKQPVLRRPNGFWGGGALCFFKFGGAGVWGPGDWGLESNVMVLIFNPQFLIEG